MDMRFTGRLCQFYRTMAAITPRWGNFKPSLSKGPLALNIKSAVYSERSKTANALSTDSVPSGHPRATVPPIIRQNEASSANRIPKTLTEAISVFLSHPTVLEVLVGMVGMGCYRLSHPLTVTDAIVGISVAVLWILQEWFLHKYLLHSGAQWMGERIHAQHHQKPYHHVCIDDPFLVLGVMCASALFFKTIFLNAPIGDTAILFYWLMGLMYIWCHFLVHTRYVPRGRLMKAIRRNHMRHHCRDNRYWFSFICPLIDRAFRTTPR